VAASLSATGSPFWLSGMVAAVAIKFVMRKAKVHQNTSCHAGAAKDVAMSFSNLVGVVFMGRI
jgi:hypothetical protein